MLRRTFLGTVAAGLATPYLARAADPGSDQGFDQDRPDHAL